MFLIAWRNLFGEKGRLVITIGGVAFAVTLILVLLGLYLGWQTQITRFLGNVDTELWVGQKGVKDMSHGVSILPASLKESLEDIDGVKSVAPFVVRQVSFEIDGKEAHLQLVGDDGTGTVKPFELIKGEERLNKNDIIVDKTFAQDKNVDIGDILEINNIEFKIVGLASGGNVMIYTYAIIRMDDFRELMNFSAFNNYYLVKTDNTDSVQDRINTEIGSLEVMKRQEFLDNTSAVVTDTFLPVVGVLLLIAIGVGITIIGLTIFTSTIEKGREYGVLKAIGYTASGLYAIALIQSLVSGLIGFIVGYLLSLGVVALAQVYVPNFIHELNGSQVALVFASAVLMSIIASFIPLHRLNTIDPATVFKA